MAAEGNVPHQEEASADRAKEEVQMRMTKGSLSVETVTPEPRQYCILCKAHGKEIAHVNRQDVSATLKQQLTHKHLAMAMGLLLSAVSQGIIPVNYLHPQTIPKRGR
jgi:hypothetical protein